jgi:tetratricopeptide (TPR) repeat protein
MAVNRRDLWEMYSKSGKTYLRMKNFNDAERMFRAALQEAESFGPADPRLGVSLNSLARVFQTRRRWADAEQFYKRALAIAAEQHGPDHPDAAVTQANLAGLFMAQDRFADAKPLLEQALATFNKAFGDAHPSLATVLDSYAMCLRKTAHDDEAVKAEEWAESIRGSLKKPKA